MDQLNNSNDTDDYYDENENDDIYESMYGIHTPSVVTDDSTIYTLVNVKNKKDVKVDNGHRIIGKKNNKLEYFSTSNMPGSIIRNAVTGIPEYNMRVGNIYAEDNFFKMVYVGNGIKSGNPDTLFYDSPEQCERHMKFRVKSELKQKWQKRKSSVISYHNE